MSRITIISLMAYTTLVVALLPIGAVGQERSLREQLVGTWLQVSIDGTFPDGTKRQLFGPNPKGILIYTSDGYFSLMQSRADLPKLEASNRATATAEEAKAVVAGSIAYFGKYSVDEEARSSASIFRAARSPIKLAVPSTTRESLRLLPQTN
jgi:hypothetical protein